MAKATTAEKATIDPTDLQEFLEMLAVTGEKTTDLTDGEDRIIQNRCWEWVQDGKPKAVMPKVSKVIEKITKVYRTKRFGKQWLYYRNQDGVQGREFVKIYGQIPEIDADGKPTGKMIDDTDNVIETKEKYTIEYTKALGEELVEKAINTALEPQFCIVQGQFKFKFESDEFNGNFDTMMKMCMRNLKA